MSRRKPLTRLAFDAAISCAASALVLAACAPGQPASSSMPVDDDAEMLDIVAADQADREEALTEMDWPAVAARDASRRARVVELIDEGRLRTGKDFERASLVFQHGETAQDILFAHVLAMTAVAEGSKDARRISALALDRYLTRIEQPQVFGTNFTTLDVSQPSQWTLEPYDERLVPDALRALNCVASQDVTRALLSRLQTTGDLSEPEPVCGDPSE